MPGVWLPALSARIVPFPRAPPPPQTYLPPQTSSALSTPTPGAEPLPQAVSRVRATLPGPPPVCPPSTTRTVRTASVRGPLPVRGVPAARASQTRISSVVRSAPFRATPPPPVVPSLHGEISAQATPARGVTPVQTGPLSHNNSSGRIFVRCDVCKTRLLTKNLERVRRSSWYSKITSSSQDLSVFPCSIKLRSTDRMRRLLRLVGRRSKRRLVPSPRVKPKQYV